MTGAASSPRPDTGSFRDRAGRVYLAGDRVLRTVMPSMAEDFEFVRSTGLVDRLVECGRLVPERRVAPGELGELHAGAAFVTEHPRLPFVSYPYEWPFPALKAAALLHLDIHMEALRHGVTLSDASAYNIQFQGANPVFIDTLSLRRYRDGEYWLGHRQFCEQFVNPLLLRSSLGIAHNSWYRGTLEGITAEELSHLLPWTRKLSWNVFTHVVLQASFQRGSRSQDRAGGRLEKRKFPRTAFEHMLRGLRKWIAKLEPRDTGATVWGNYAGDNSYATDEANRKAVFIDEFAAATEPALVWDIGCNTGDYSKVALDAGAGYAVGFDFDHSALDSAFERARRDELRFLPLFLDVANPAPSQGWGQTERKGLSERAPADAVMALALVHHMAIARNIPLQEVVRWIVGLAPQGVIEFVPKSDPMVARLLQLREDIFEDYGESQFERLLGEQADIVKAEPVSDTGRRLFWFSRQERRRRPSQAPVEPMHG